MKKQSDTITIVTWRCLDLWREDRPERRFFTERPTVSYLFGGCNLLPVDDKALGNRLLAFMREGDPKQQQESRYREDGQHNNPTPMMLLAHDDRSARLG